MQALLQDLRFAIRQIRKSPGFCLTTVLTLALGIGATTAIFSLINAVLLRPLPFPNPDRLLYLQEEDHSSGAAVPENLSYLDFFDWRNQSRSFEAMASYHHDSVSLTGSGEPLELQTQVVSAGFFQVLGVPPLLGRGFLREEEKPGTRVAVLSHELWQSKFGSARDIVGRSITLDNFSYTVVGVMPAGFSFPLSNPATALWTTIGDDEGALKSRGQHMMDVIARLKPGVSISQARADLNLVSQQLAAQYPDTNKHFTTALVEPELDNLVGDTRPALRVLFAAVAFVLLIACVNVAGLMLARASRRRPEIAVRSALGATRFEIIRQGLVESVLLALLGGATGVALSILLLKFMLGLVPQNLPRLDQVSVDATVLAFAAFASILTGLFFGVLPAWRMSRLDPALALREGTRNVTSGRGQHRVYDSLVIAETAMGMILLVGAGLLIHSFVRVLNVEPGFDPQRVLTSRMGLPVNRYQDQKRVQFVYELISRLEAQPGVQSVAAGWPIPMTGGEIDISFKIEGRPVAESDEPTEHLAVITPGYFRTLGIPLVAGRDFTRNDDVKGPKVVIVNQAFALKYFPGENPLGKRFEPGLSDAVTPASMREIVGVVGDVKRTGLTARVDPQYYLPYAQAAVTTPLIAIRTMGDPAAMLGPLRTELGQMDASVPLYRVSTLADAVSRTAAQPRFQTMLITCFAALALLLSAVGLYGVLSYMVAQRTLEIGLRLALGAQRDNVLGLFLRRGMLLAGAGLSIGILVALLLTRFMQEMLFGVGRFDPLTFVAVSAVLLLVSLIASSVPAYRAARLDPMQTLREH